MRYRADVTQYTPQDRAFLDSAGSAPLLDSTLAAFAEARTHGWADPNRLHHESRSARGLLDASRQAIAEVVGARAEEVHFAPSHTAAAHTVIASVARGRRRLGSRIVVGAVERASILAATYFACAEDPENVRISPVNPVGRVDAGAFISQLTQKGVGLACLQHANGEVGSTQPLAEVHAAARSAGVPLLVDAGASLGHVDVGSDWDALLASPADWGGPDGVGILVVRRGVRTGRVHPEDADLWFPGGVSVSAAFAAAVSLQTAVGERSVTDPQRRALVDHLRTRIPELVPDVEILGAPDERLPHVLTFSCLFVEGEALVTELDREGFAVGSGSACTSLTLEPSHVLAAMGALTHGNIRLVLHPGVSSDDVERFLTTLPGAVARVRESMGVTGL